jgi:hypothetical protein
VGIQILNYFEQFIDKNYQRLKTTDNLYKYKIQTIELINLLRLNDDLQDELSKVALNSKKFERFEEANAYVFERIEIIRRIFDEIEDIVCEIDYKHQRFMNTTITRYQYLQNQDKNYVGNLLSLIKCFSVSPEETVEAINNYSILYEPTIFRDESLYKTSKVSNFEEGLLEVEEESTDTEEQIKIINELNAQLYSTEKIESYLSTVISGNRIEAKYVPLNDDQDFYNIIRAFNYMDSNSDFSITAEEGFIETDKHRISNFNATKKEVQRSEHNRDVSIAK